MAKKQISLLFGVAGEGRIDGASGANILNQLNSITKAISDKKPPQVKLSLSVDETKKLMKQQLAEIVKGLSIGDNGSLGVFERTVSRTMKSASQSVDTLTQRAIAAQKAFKAINFNGASFNKGMDKTTAQFKEIQPLIEQFQSASAGMNTEDQSSMKKVISLWNQLQQAIKNAKTASAQMKYESSESTTFDKLTQKAIAYYNVVQNALSRSPEMTARMENIINNLNTHNYASANEGLQDLFKFENEVHALGLDAETTGQKIKGMFQKVFGYGSIAIAFNYLKQVLKGVLDNVVAIDKAMTQLEIVSGKTGQSLSEVFDSAADSAQRLGSSVTDVLASMEVFARLGYNTSDSSKLAEAAMTMANVAGTTTDEATTGLTSIIKGYGLDASKAMDVASILTNVGNKYAVSASQLMEALQRGGAALSASNTSLEKSVALIAAGNASVQDSSVVGTALKSVSARIRGSKTDLEELGEDMSDLAGGFSKYREELKALTGFDIMKDDNTFKDIYDIFTGIGGKWNGLQDTSKSRVAEILGGTRQYTVVASIMQNMADATNAYSDAMNSAGVAEAKQQVYLESVAGRASQLSATFQELSADLMDSGIVSGFLQVSNFLLKIVDWLAKIQVLIPMIVIAVTSIVALKPLTQAIALFQSAGASSEAFTTAVGGLSNANKRLLLALLPVDAETKKTIMADITATGAHTKHALSIKAVTGALWDNIKATAAWMVTNPVGQILLIVSAVMILVSAFNLINQKIEEHKQKIYQTAEDTNNELDSISNKLDEIQSKIQAISSQPLTLTNEAELEKLNAESIALQTKKKSLEDIAKIQNQKAFATLQSDTMYDIGRKTYLLPSSEYWTSGFDTLSDEELDKVKNRIVEMQSLLMNGIEKANSFGYTADNNATVNSWQSMYYRWADTLAQNTFKSYSFNNVLSSEKFADIVTELQNTSDVSAELLSQDRFKGFIDELRTCGVIADDSVDSLQLIAEQFHSIRDESESATSSFKSFLDIMNSIQDEFDDFNAALDDMGNYGIVTAKNVESLTKIIERFQALVASANEDGNTDLARTYQDVLNHIGLTANGYILMEGAYDSYTKASRAQYEAEVAKAQGDAQALAVAKANLQRFDAVWNMLEATTKLEEQKKALQNNLDSYKDLIDLRKELLQTYQKEVEYQKELEKKQKKVAELQTSLTLAKLDTSAAGRKRVRELENELNEAKDALDDFTLQHAVETVCAQLDSEYSEFKNAIEAQTQALVAALQGLDLTSAGSFISNTREDDIGGGYEGAGSPSQWISFSSKESFMAAMKMYDPDADESELAGIYDQEYYNKIPFDSCFWVNTKNGRVSKTQPSGVYHSGGFVGGVKSNEEFAKLLKGEYVVTPELMSNFMKQTMPQTMLRSASSVGGDNNLYIQSPLVEMQVENLSKDNAKAVEEMENRVADQAIEKLKKMFQSGMSRTNTKIITKFGF